jgi:AraC-like DNA-binding protein
MLYLRHRFAPREVDAEFVQHELRGDGLVVIMSSYAGGRFDERLSFPGPGAAPEKRERGRLAPPNWSRMRVVLEGGLIFNKDGAEKEARAGDAIIARDWSDFPVRTATRRTRYLYLAWRHGQAGDAPSVSELQQGSLADGRGARALELAEAFDANAPRMELLQRASRLLSTLSEVGMCADSVRSAGEGIRPADERFAAALERSFFPLSDRPMVVDLMKALNLGERQVLRLAADYFERFYVTVGSWRSYVQGMRLELSAFAASSPFATLERVRRAVGFSSPTALCHAFHAAGLLSPQAFQRELAHA